MPVPPLLRDLAGWTWRALVLALAGYLLVQLFDKLYLVVLPFSAALLFTALVYPVVQFFANRGLNRGTATGLTLLLAFLIVGGIGIFVVDRAVSQYSDLVDQVDHAVTSFRHFLTVDLHVKSSSTSSLQKTISNYLQTHKSAIASGALSGIATVGEILGGIILWFFMTFFLLYDGHNIWAWIVRLFPASSRARAYGAGEQAWARLSGYVRGTFIIAIIHGVTAAIALTILGVPLVAPIALLIFIGSFLPIIGSILFGTLAVAVTLVTQGWVAGVILIAVLVVDNQIEAHVLQPFLVGRYVRLHPLAIAIAIAGGALLEGIEGTILAVPFVAVVYGVLRFLALGDDEPEPEDEEPTRGTLGGDVPDDQPEPRPAKKATARKTAEKRAPAKKAAAKKSAARRPAPRKAPASA
jgi:predicted PurR-regulated permease PerM